MQETYRSTTGDDAFNAISYIGYNNLEGRFEIVWMDDETTSLYIETGRYNPESQIFHSHGVTRDAETGFIIRNRTEMKLSDPEKHTISSFFTDESGIEFKNFAGVFTRKH